MSFAFFLKAKKPTMTVNSANIFIKREKRRERKNVSLFSFKKYY